MSPRHALVLAGLVGVANGQGLASCRCLTSYPAGVTVNSDGQPIVTIEGVRTPRTFAAVPLPLRCAATAQLLRH